MIDSMHCKSPELSETSFSPILESSVNRILIDCTNTVLTGHGTGIQRVVRNIITRTQLIKNTFHVEAVPVLMYKDKIVKVNVEQIEKNPTISDDIKVNTKNARQYFLILRKNLVTVERYIKNSFELLGNGRLRNLIESMWQELRYFIKCLWFQYSAWRYTTSSNQKIVLSSRDLVILPDANWEPTNINQFQGLKESCAGIIPIIYDVIPVTHPHFFENETCKMFEKSLESLSDVASGFICGSKSTMLELQKYMVKAKPGCKQLPMDYFYLGADFNDGINNNEFYIDDDIKKIYSDEPVFLMVGTIELRKNHEFVIDTFERYWRQGGRAKLVIIGRLGWKSDKIVKRIKSSQITGNPLYWLNNANDNALTYSYQHSRALIIASVTEGFGLPLVEAMTSGIEIIASDIPVFHEIGGDYPEYFNLNDHNSLMKTIKKKIQTKPSMVKLAWQNWDASVEMLIERSLRLTNKCMRGKYE